ncbi:hypothetical protein CROQUDRAFT_653820 [Cronartium quercuum f. sp. fusiforme G11]|uniref:Uncharacterized protein n=1 Tax=Cronartium quercuum f. sp. fusiforme G11 TaxID=708437 RepID=A0A9P6NPE5_9BASI|nr:hypothetical protein CROQUDRAFT_653820 [Cronartium quercuum f. sp. fusiforme G11]
MSPNPRVYTPSRAQDVTITTTTQQFIIHQPIPTNPASTPTHQPLSIPTQLPSPHIPTTIDPERSPDDILCLLLLQHLLTTTPQSSFEAIYSTLIQLQQFNPSLIKSLGPQHLHHLRTIICPTFPTSTISTPYSDFFNYLCLSQPSSRPQTHNLYLQQSTNQPHSKRSIQSTPPKPLFKRQSTQGNGSGPSADGYPSCTAVSNAILSCFPENNTTLVQNTWSKFIWNNNYPTFIGSKNVDIYLFNAQSETIVANWTSIPNDRGMIGIYASDNWFPNETNWVEGKNLSFPYFFVITGSGSPLTGGEQHQATFTVVQTAAPLSLVSSTFASIFLHPNGSTHPLTASSPTSTSPSSLQQASGNDSFPKWEIALIVVLGILALVTFLIATYLTVHNARRRRQIRNWRQVGLGGSGGAGSVASHSPMIQNPEGRALMGMTEKRAGGVTSPSSSRPGSPLSATATASIPYPPAIGGITAGSASGGPTSGVGVGGGEVDGPISSVDASIMADAFRKALRKPEFAPTTQDEEANPSPAPDTTSPIESQSFAPAPTRTRESMKAQVISIDDGLGIDNDDVDDEDAREIMDRELASEGRSMTSVDVRKRPEVHP